MIPLRRRRRHPVAANRGTSSVLRRLLAGVAAGLVAGLATVVGLSSPAAAHGQFVSSIPVNGTEVSEPLADLFLYFTEKPTSNAYFAVTAPSGVRIDRVWEHGPTRPLDPPVHEWYHEPDGDWVTRTYTTAYSARIPIAYWPEVGEYTVEFISVATDGQPVRGKINFTYSGPVAPQPADYRPQQSEPDPILLTIAVTDAPTAPPSAPDISQVIAEQEAGPGLWVLWVPVGLALAAALAIALFWRLRPEQARELMISRFGGRYAAPTQRRPSLPPGLADRVRVALPVGARGRADEEASGPAAAAKPGGKPVFTGSAGVSAQAGAEDTSGSSAPTVRSAKPGTERPSASSGPSASGGPSAGAATSERESGE